MFPRYLIYRDHNTTPFTLESRIPMSICNENSHSDTLHQLKIMDIFL